MTSNNISNEEYDNIRDFNEDVLEDMNSTVSTMNIFFMYYRNLYKEDGFRHLLDGVHDEDDETATNRPQELFYEELLRYQSMASDPDMIDLFPYEDVPIELKEKLQDAYILYIEKKPTYVSGTLYSLLRYMSSQHWELGEWEIISGRKEHELPIEQSSNI